MSQLAWLVSLKRKLDHIKIQIRFNSIYERQYAKGINWKLWNIYVQYIEVTTCIHSVHSSGIRRYISNSIYGYIYPTIFRGMKIPQFSSQSGCKCKGPQILHQQREQHLQLLIREQFDDDNVRIIVLVVMMILVMMIVVMMIVVLMMMMMANACSSCSC